MQGEQLTAPGVPLSYNSISETTPTTESGANGLLQGVTGQLLVALAYGPACGAVTVNPDGSFAYTPDLSVAAQPATVTFQYLISDGLGATVVSTVTLNLG